MSDLQSIRGEDMQFKIRALLVTAGIAHIHGHLGQARCPDNTKMHRAAT